MPSINQRPKCLVMVLSFIMVACCFSLRCKGVGSTLQGINISHLGKRKIIFKMPFFGDMLVPWRVSVSIMRCFPSIPKSLPPDLPALSLPVSPLVPLWSQATSLLRCRTHGCWCRQSRRKTGRNSSGSPGQKKKSKTVWYN